MNITLIGMPGSGKSYIGEKLARKLGFTFIDFDTVIRQKYSTSLQSVVDTLGDEGFLQEEARTAIKSTQGKNALVISPGGSIIYSETAMKYLQDISTIMYLQIDLNTVQKRIEKAPRGIIGSKEKTLPELYAERTPLYQKWAHSTVNALQSPDTLLEEIVRKIPPYSTQ